MGGRRDRDAREGRGNCVKCITLGESHSDSAQKDCPGCATQVSYVCGLSCPKLSPAPCGHGTFESQGDIKLGTHPKDR